MAAVKMIKLIRFATVERTLKGCRGTVYVEHKGTSEIQSREGRRGPRV